MNTIKCSTSLINVNQKHNKIVKIPLHTHWYGFYQKQNQNNNNKNNKNKNNKEDDNGSNPITMKSEGIILFSKIWLESLLAKGGSLAQGDLWLKSIVIKRFPSVDQKSWCTTTHGFFSLSLQGKHGGAQQMGSWMRALVWKFQSPQSPMLWGGTQIPPPLHCSWLRAGHTAGLVGQDWVWVRTLWVRVLIMSLMLPTSQLSSPEEDSQRSCLEGNHTQSSLTSWRSLM